MIFDKFYRGQSQRYLVQGTGMGLAIVKAIVEAHSARIESDQPARTRIGVLLRAASGFSANQRGQI